MKTIRIQDMETRIRYRVVRGVRGVLRKGDSVFAYSNGDIGKYDDVLWSLRNDDGAPLRATVALDMEYYTDRIRQAKSELEKIRLLVERHA